MKFILGIALILSVSFASAQTEQFAYKKAIGRFQKYYNNNQPDSLFNMFSPEVQQALPLDKTKALIIQMQAQMGQLMHTNYLKNVSTAAVYKADFTQATLLINLSLNTLNQVNGLYFKPYEPEKSLAASDKMPLDPSLTEESVSLKTLAGTVSGTLTLPKTPKGKIPVVLIIAGSGPTDRDCNSPTMGLHTNAYRMLAEALGKSGIASLRYDKRGIGASTTSAKEIDTRFTDFVDDASGLITTLKDDQRFSKVIVLGHSEGSLIGMIACFADQTVNGYISVAGAGQPADIVLTEQMKSQPPSVAAEFKTIVDSLHRGKTVPKVDPALYSLLRPSIQPYMMSWMAFDPQRIIRKLKLPILIIQGTTDLQVTVGDAERLKKAKSEATLKIIDGMNHILKDAPADRAANVATYNNPTLPLKPEFAAAVIEFINKLK